MQITSLTSCVQKLDGGTLFGHVPKVLWEKWIPADEKNRCSLACRSLLIRTENRTVLVEAGLERHVDDALADRFGIEGEPETLHRNLAAAGVTEEEVDYVILSHLHFDHAGAVLPPWPAMENPGWNLRFPNAQYVVSAAQLGRSSLPEIRDRMSFVNGLAAKLRQSDRLITIGSGHDRIRDLPGFSFILSDGHSPGVLHTLIQGPDRPLCYTSDLIPGTAWVHLPVTTGYDRCAEETVKEKKKLLDRAIKENWLLVYPHDPAYAVSGVAIDGKGRYQAVGGLPELKQQALWFRPDP